MCMGENNIRNSEDKFALITCKLCGKKWIVEKAAAEEFNTQQNGLCAECYKKSKEKFSLVKRKTNNDRINEMNVEEKANFFDDITRHCSNNECERCPLEKVQPCDVFSITQWLESEAEESDVV